MPMETHQLRYAPGAYEARPDSAEVHELEDTRMSSGDSQSTTTASVATLVDSSSSQDRTSLKTGVVINSPSSTIAMSAE